MEREVSDVSQMEVKGSIASDGSIILPPGVVETMGQGRGIRYRSCMRVRSRSARRTAMGNCIFLRMASGKPHAWSCRKRRK